MLHSGGNPRHASTPVDRRRGRHFQSEAEVTQLLDLMSQNRFAAMQQ
jgi:hypothetical protein